MARLEDVCDKASSNIAQKDLEGNEGKYPIFGASGFIKNVDFYKQEKEYIAIVKDGAGVGRTMLLPAKSSVIGTMQYIIPKENVDTRFLCHVIEWMDLGKYCTGATIPHIYFKDYKNEKFNLPDLVEQRKIADKIEKVDELISCRKEQLAKLDKLVKARFVEMFGELGCDIFGNGLISLGDCCKINPKKGQDNRLVPDLKVSFVPMPAVSEKGEIDTSEEKIYDEVKTGFTYFAENDVLFAKITPCMENGKGAVAKGLINGIGFGSTEFHVLRPVEGISNPYWLYEITAFEEFRKNAAENMTGSAGQRRVPASFLENYKIALPPLELQNQFAAFVGQTEKTKAEVQKSLNELETLKKSLMQKYFG